MFSFSEQERGEGKDDLKAVDIHGFFKYLKENEHECIIVMPQCPLNTFWAARDEMVSKLKEYNSDVRYSLFDGVGHDVWKQAYNKDLIEWFMSEKR